MVSNVRLGVSCGLQSTTRYFMWFLSFKFSNKTVLSIPLFAMPTACPTHLILLVLIALIKFSKYSLLFPLSRSKHQSRIASPYVPTFSNKDHVVPAHDSKHKHSFTRRRRNASFVAQPLYPRVKNPGLYVHFNRRERNGAGWGTRQVWTFD